MSQYKQWIPAGALIGVIAVIAILRWWGGQPSLRPSSMPTDSVWIEAPALPFSWHHGWWFGCWINSDGLSDRRRLWSQGLENPIVFDGKYISCENQAPVPANELKLMPPPDSMQMWVGVTSGEVAAPAAFLQNGKHLVPVASPHGCEESLRKPKNQP